MSFIQNQHIQSGTATGFIKLPIVPNYSLLHVAVEDETVAVKVIPQGLTTPQGDGEMVVNPNLPAAFNIPPSSDVILTSVRSGSSFKFSVAQE